MGGTIEDLKKLGRTETLQSKVRAASSGSLSDPAGMLQDAIGRFTEIEEGSRQAAASVKWCKDRVIDDGRYIVPFEPDMDIVIVLAPYKDKLQGVNEEVIETELYIVFGRKLEGNIPGTCFACNNAEKQKRPAKVHNCFRKKFFPNWVPINFARAHGIDDAEDLAKELRSAWAATAEQMLDDNAKIDWSRITDQNFDNSNGREFSFSNDFLGGMVTANPNLWSSLSADQQAEVDS